jgi:hypothetical protein
VIIKAGRSVIALIVLFTFVQRAQCQVDGVKSTSPQADIGGVWHLNHDRSGRTGQLGGDASDGESSGRLTGTRAARRRPVPERLSGPSCGARSGSTFRETLLAS